MHAQIAHKRRYCLSFSRAHGQLRYLSRLLLHFVVLSWCCAGLVAHAETVVTDQRGHTLVLTQPVARVVTIPIPMASMVIALDGGTSRLVGMHPSSQQSVQEGVLGTLFPQALDIRTDVVQGQSFIPNRETLLALRPDAVLQWTEPVALLDSIGAIGINAVGLINNPPDQSVLEQNIRIVGQVLGQEAKAAALIARQQAVLQELKQHLAALPPAAPPKVMYLREASKAGFVPTGSNSYNHFWITLCGGENVAASLNGTGGNISAEQLLAWNPDFILLGSFDSSTPSLLYDDPALQTLSAVRKRQVYKFPHGGYRWDPGSQESHLTWVWVAQLLHQGQIPMDLRRMIQDEFLFLYGQKPGDAAIDRILQTELNSSSRNYAIFADSAS